jgi:hypothetical protein
LAPRKQSSLFALGRQKVADLGRQKMADFRNPYERMAARPVLLDAELIRMVSELTRDVEQFDSLLQSQRQLLQRTSDGEKAERQWRKIRAQVGRIKTKVHAVLDEISDN